MLIWTNSQAVILSDLNTVKILVKDTSVSSRQVALSQALGAVLVKMSGNSKITTLPMIHNMQLKANRFVQSYTYLSHDVLDDSGSLALQVSFDKKELKHILRQSQQSIWSSDRPLTLLWIDVEDGSDHQVLSSTTDSPLIEILQKTADVRGVPILFPAMDLQDWSLTDFSVDKEGTYSAVNYQLLQKMLTRYNAVVLLAGYLERVDTNRWQGQWLLWLEGAPYRWHSQPDEMDEVLSQAINNTVNLMVNQYTVVSSNNLKKKVLLAVSQVNDLSHYAKVLAKLRHLVPVAKVTLEDIKGSNILLDLEVIGGTQALVQALSTQSCFLPALAAPSHCSNDSDRCADLYYRWNLTSAMEDHL